MVLDYIRSHPAEDISVERLANVAAFSPFHFHRLFTSMVGETVNQCTVRLRLERAIALLKAAPDQSVTKIAADCGFTSLPVFSRTFKKYFGMSPGQWDRQSPLKDSKNGQHPNEYPHYTMDDMQKMSEQPEQIVQIKPLPPHRIAYIRVTDAYQPGKLSQAYERLIAWYQQQGGELVKSTLIGMSQDDPDVVPMELCRYDICLTIPNDWLPAGDIDIRTFPACQIAYIHCAGDIRLIDRAIQYLYRYWLPNSTYLPDNLPALEIYHQQPYEIGWDVYNLDCAIPIVLLNQPVK